MHVHMNILDKINLADIAHNSVDRNVSRKHFDIFLRIIAAHKGGRNGWVRA